MKLFEDENFKVLEFAYKTPELYYYKELDADELYINDKVVYKQNIVKLTPNEAKKLREF